MKSLRGLKGIMGLGGVMGWKSLLIAGAGLMSLGCKPTLISRFLTAAETTMPQEVVASNARARSDSGPCRDVSYYIPDPTHLEQFPLKIVRLNIHWVNSSDSSLNYFGEQAYEFTRILLESANNDLAKNAKMWLPQGNETPVLPVQYQYELTPDPLRPGDKGIYFHFDDQMYHIHKGPDNNIYERKVFEKYGVQKDSVLNVFILPHQRDSIASSTYNAFGVGVSLSGFVKLAGVFENKGEPWGYRGLFNHEIGHTFTLQHTWAFNDGCDDTPRHDGKCWNRSKEPPCDKGASNNVMDYNAMQNAWTPCQIGKIHLVMSNERSAQRKFLKPTWCTLDESKTITVLDTMEWNGAKDLEGNVVIKNKAQLTIRCRVSLAANATITLEPGGKLIIDGGRLHNACGSEWRGIEVQELGKLKGEVVVLNGGLVQDAVSIASGTK